MDRLEATRTAGQLIRSGARDALPEGDPVRPDELDRGTRLEAALAAHDAHAEQARPLVDERRLRPVVDVQLAGNRLAEPEPELERGLPALVRRESRSPGFTGEDRPEHLLAETAGDHSRDAGRRGHLRSDDLAAHSATAERGAHADLGLECQLALGDQLSPGRPRRTRVDAFHLGEEDEQP